MGEKEKWTEKNIKSIKELITDFKELLASQKSETERLMEVIRSNRNSDKFMEKFTSEEIAGINLIETGLPDLLVIITEYDEQITLYENSLYEVTPSSVFSYVNFLPLKMKIIQRCLTRANRFINRHAEQEKPSVLC